MEKDIQEKLELLINQETVSKQENLMQAYKEIFEFYKAKEAQRLEKVVIKIEAESNKEIKETLLKKEREFQELLNRGFCFQYDEDEKEADILFIGINPSFDNKNLVAENSAWSYTRPNENNTDKILAYFKAFKDISHEVKAAKNTYNGIYTHIDLLVFREKEQNFIYNLFGKENGVDFILPQLYIAKERLIKIQPKVVVVSNTMARKLLGKDRSIDKNNIEHNVWMDFHFVFDKEFGCHKVSNIPALENTYFFFSSMLSGQRALDLGSRERLIWQMQRLF